MRPEQLYPIFAQINTLKGVGDRLAQKFHHVANGEKIWNLLCHFPRAVLTRVKMENLAQARNYDGQEVLINAIPIQHIAPPRRGMPYRVMMADPDSMIGERIEIVFFSVKHDYLNRYFPLHQQLTLAGRIDIFREKLQIVHPHIINKIAENETQQTDNLLEPIYPLTAGLTRIMFRKIMNQALTKIPTLPPLPEWLDEGIIAEYHLPSFKQAFTQIHQPQNEADILPESPARIRLALDELYANQLMLGLIKKYSYRHRKNRDDTSGNLALCNQIISELPFALTGSQQQVFAEITQSLQQPTRMLRLLQGDVGSGKTIIALLTMLLVAGSNGQAALMAPTDILAKQHYDNFTALLQHHSIDIVLLTGKMRAADKKAALERINHDSINHDGINSRPQMIIGTHALFQEQVRYHDLRIAVIDEQHRFGVHQRLIFSEKSQSLDMLVMSATPIPRTLMLSYWHNLEISRLTELPKGRTPIITRLFSQSRIDDIIAALKRAINEGRKIYWVCPLIEPTDIEANSEPQNQQKSDVISRSAMLAQHFSPELVEQLHGKMPSTQKEKALKNFTEGKAQILVATTVIEVGIDVKEASIMVIEHAEQFGLAALHQLRGRIGRGSIDSYCLLIHQDRLSYHAQERLKTIRNNHDGFIIAETDLKLRGGGDILGVRQSGLPDFKFVDWQCHHHLLGHAQTMAEQSLSQYHNHDKASKEKITLLLHLFEHDNAVRLIQST
ncbi:MAG: ATP-dependent DNA helicase RecG [Alphaproteobacteria bacterium]|nr:ATP-dependent DNA helicase RecG [Alphaproteobacteria bacterium]